MKKGKVMRELRRLHKEMGKSLVGNDEDQNRLLTIATQASRLSLAAQAAAHEINGEKWEGHLSEVAWKYGRR